MISELVSVVTPCYNGGKYLMKYFESLMNQTYQNIEIIFIDDGSTDNTRDIVLHYKEKFERKGIRFCYLYQQNSGQAAAINKGLREVQGEYLTWPDSDDWLSADSIEERVLFLQNNNDYDIVACAVQFFEESDLTTPQSVRLWKHNEEDFFYDVLMGRVIIYSGIYMVRSNALFRALGGRKIIESPIGQNWQLLLPIAYNNKCAFINKRLHNVTVHQDSHSRSIQFNKIGNKYVMECKRLIREILESIDMSQSEKLSAINAYDRERDLLLLHHFFLETGKVKEEEVKLFEKYYISLKELRIMHKKIWIWGAGKIGKGLKQWLEEVEKIKIEGFIDSDEEKIKSGVYCDSKVIDFSQYNKDESFLIIPIKKYESIKKKLDVSTMKSGRDYVYPLYDI